MNSAASAQFAIQPGERESLTVLALAFADQEIRWGKTTEIKRAIQSGGYRIPASILAASLMLDMLP